MTFHGVLPLLGLLGRPGSAIRGGQDGSNYLIYLVDDDDAVRTTLARLIKLSGYEVREFASGAELLDAVTELDSGCILLDLNMPGANGIAVQKALKDRSIDIPVILMTGAGDLAVSPMGDDVAAILQKPFRRAELIALLDEFGIRPNAEAKTP